LSDSDWALNIAFPVFVANLLEWATPNALINPLQAPRNARIAFNPPAEARSLLISAPDGTSTRLSVGESALTSAQTSQVGIYQVELRDSAEQSLEQAAFAINAFSPAESAIAPRNLDFASADDADTGRTEATLGRLVLREWWQIPLVLAGLVLALEWWVYTQRYRQI
jgi:hypothetical protein